MKVHELIKEHILPVRINEAWDFFSNPANLNEITPDFLNFSIVSNPSKKMFNSQIIVYRIGLLPMITTTWVTEIKSVEDKKSFIDEQRFGPYKFWHHLHLFEEVESGTKITDHIHYAMPFSLIGEIVHMLFVRRRLNKIFDYRLQILRKKFGNT